MILALIGENLIQMEIGNAGKLYTEMEMAMASEKFFGKCHRTGFHSPCFIRMSWETGNGSLNL
jgi:hypothetical protein